MTAEATEDDPLIGKLVADRYRVQRKLGEGGMGVVYQAVHEALRKPVAIKVLATGGRIDREAVARFEREAIAAANLRHPNIAEATDFGKLPEGGFYLVMEFVEGTTLRKLIREHHALPPERALAILKQVGAALKAAHARDVVHRDLKPENVIVTTGPDGVDVVKVIDFGIAKIRNATFGGASAVLTKAGTVFGTPEYMAPEQVVGQAVDARGDQYALGVLAFELFTGKPPFSAPDMGQLMMMHVGAPIPSSRERAPALPASVDAVLTKMLAKLPDERFASVGDAIQGLAAAFAGAPPSIVEAASGPMSSGATVKIGGGGAHGTIVNAMTPPSARSVQVEAAATGAQAAAAFGATLPSMHALPGQVESPSSVGIAGAPHPLGSTYSGAQAAPMSGAQAAPMSGAYAAPMSGAYAASMSGAYAAGSLPQGQAQAQPASPQPAQVQAQGQTAVLPGGALAHTPTMLRPPAKKGPPIIAIGIAVASLLAGVLLLVLFARSCGHREGLPSEVTAALADWKSGRFDMASGVISSAIGSDATIADDATLTQTLASTVGDEAGERALAGLLGATALGRSTAMASALASMAMKDDPSVRDGALELLRERQNLLTKEQGARVRLRDAEDCEALAAAAAEETDAATSATQRDLERLRNGDCRMLRVRELCEECRGGGKGPAKGKGRGKDKGRRPDD